MREYVAEKFTHAGFTVKIIADQDALAPDEYEDNGLFIVTTRNRYFQKLHNGMDAKECMEDKELSKKYWIFPLNAYIHSGVSLSLSSGYPYSDVWDGGQIGFVFAAKEEWKYRTRERKKCVSALKAATGYVETWNQFLSGDIWGIVVESPDDEDGDFLDSCWGFYGLDYARQEGKEMAEQCAKSAAKVDKMEQEQYAL